MRRLIAARHRDERGAVAVIFAALLASGVFLGCVALSVDFGHFNANHSQLQSSAAAAARSAADTCATTDACPDEASLDSISQANDNDSEHSSSVTSMCGNGPGLLPCDGSSNDTGRVTECPDFDPPANYVQVLTQKKTDFTFDNNGAGGEDTGQACAAVAWGPLGKHTAVLPVTFSACEWQDATGGDPLADPPTAHYAPSPPYPPTPPADMERTIVLAKNTGPCPTFNGHDAPGGFGWIDNNNCHASVTTGDWIHVDTGNNTPSGCDIEALRNKVVLIPVFDCMNKVASWPADPATQCSTGNGQHTYYHIVSFAAFYLTGWRLSGSSEASSVTGNMPCTGGARCLGGFFVKDTGDYGDISDDPDIPDFGVDTIQPIG